MHIRRALVTHLRNLFIWSLILRSEPRDIRFADPACILSADSVERGGVFAPELLSNPSVHFANLGNVVGWTLLPHVPEVPHRFGL